MIVITRAIQLYTEGLSIRGVAAALGISSGTAQRILQRANVPFRSKAVARKNWKPSPESIEKMRQTKLGMVQTQESNAKRSRALQGRPKSAAFSLHMSVTRRGKQNPNFNPNLTEADRTLNRMLTLGYMDWIKTVYARDSYCCQVCGSSRNLNAHHLDGYADHPAVRVDPSNGVTLCQKHHFLFHKKWGRKHNTRSQYNQFYQEHVQRNAA